MAVGLDIGSKTIKILELDKKGESFELKGSGVVGYQGALIESISDEKELGSIAAIIRKLHKEARISSKDVIISLPENKVFTRTVRFPMLTDSEIDSAVKWESEQYIPIPIDDAVIQHQIIEKNDKATPPGVIVLLIAVQQALVEKYIRLVQLAGLNVILVESEMLSLVRSLSDSQRTTLLADFGAQTTDIGITRAGNLVFSRSIPMAGEALTRAVMQTLGVDYQRAEEYKKAYGLNPNVLEGKVAGALLPIVKGITNEIKKAISFYQTEEKGETPKDIIISGGTSTLPSLSSIITKELNLEFTISDPFSKMQIAPETLKSLSGFSPLYAIAVGLAMKQ